MEEELESLHKNKTWDLVELPKDKSAVGCKWIFQRREALSEKDEEKFKAQLLVKGMHNGKVRATIKFSLRL